MWIMGTVFGALLALFAVWLSVVVTGTPDDPDEWAAPVSWGVFLQFVLWVVLLFSYLSVTDTAP